MPQSRLCTQTCAFQLNCVLVIEKILTTAHWFGQNGNSNSRDSQIRDYTVHRYVYVYTHVDYRRMYSARRTGSLMTVENKNYC